MINTINKTLEAQEKTQDIKQSPSMKIGTKPYARSRRNELTEVTGRSDQEARQQKVSAAETRCWWQIDRMQVYSVQSSKERFQSGEIVTGHVRWHVTGRWQRPIS